MKVSTSSSGWMDTYSFSDYSIGQFNEFQKQFLNRLNAKFVIISNRFSKIVMNQSIPEKVQILFVQSTEKDMLIGQLGFYNGELNLTVSDFSKERNPPIVDSKMLREIVQKTIYEVIVSSRIQYTSTYTNKLDDMFFHTIHNGIHLVFDDSVDIFISQEFIHSIFSADVAFDKAEIYAVAFGRHLSSPNPDVKNKGSRVCKIPGEMEFIYSTEDYNPLELSNPLCNYVPTREYAPRQLIDAYREKILCCYLPCHVHRANSCGLEPQILFDYIINSILEKALVPSGDINRGKVVYMEFTIAMN